MSKNFVELMAKWREDPEAFVREAVGAVPTNQQCEVLGEVRKLVRAKLRFKEGLALDDMDKHYVSKVGISIMSGKGTGKNALLAWLTLWFKLLYKGSKFPITGPTYEQCRDIYLAEVTKWCKRTDAKGAFIFPFADVFSIGADTIRVKGDLGFAKIRTAPRTGNAEAQSGVLGGWHEDYMMVIVDEASDVPEPVFKAFDSTLTKPVNFVIMAFNPIRNTGYAHDTHFGKQELTGRWIQAKWDSRKSSNVPAELIKQYADLYGADSPEYRINVLGLPPSTDKAALIPYEWCMAAVEKDFEVSDDAPIIFGVDVARQGSDSSVILVRKGWKVMEITELRSLKTDELMNWVLMKYHEHEPALVCVDSCGLGGPLCDFLRPYIKRLKPVDVSQVARREDRFKRLRDELWWTLRERFELGLIQLPNNRKLVNELSSMRYEIKEEGKVKIEGKKDMISRGFPSPNLADALMLTVAANDGALSGFKKREYRELTEGDSRFSWMKM